jgi:hypothetical protein
MTDERIRYLVEQAVAGKAIHPKHDKVTVPMAHAIMTYVYGDLHNPPDWVKQSLGSQYEIDLKQVEKACTKF